MNGYSTGLFFIGIAVFLLFGSQLDICGEVFLRSPINECENGQGFIGAFAALVMFSIGCGMMMYELISRVIKY